MDVKYQVFISSTYEDLQSARREVIEALMNLGHIPVGMENFQAGNQTQWEYIKKRIQQYDYYFVIVAERYGSEEPQSQKSYTRLEYEFAIDNGIPVAGFLLSDEARQSWPSQHVEHMKLEQINSFRSLCKTKMVRYWPIPEKLGALVLPALLELIDEHPRPGWVRRDPQVFATITAQASRRGAPAKPELHPTKWADNEELVTVRPEWGRTEYDRAFVANLIRNDSSAAEKISNQYVESGANSEEERATWLAEAELHRLIFRVHGDIRRLRHSQSGTRRAPMWRRLMPRP